MDDLIREKILQAILEGYYKWGEKLPSENQLAEEFLVPRMTVRKALLMLEDMGYVYSHQGKGRYLREKQARIPLNLTGEESFTEKLTREGYNLKTNTLSYKEILWNEKIARQIQASREDTIYRIERLRLLDGKPVAIHTSYLKESLFPDISIAGDSISSLYAYFKAHGFRSFYSSKSLVSISLPTMDEQNLLGCPPLVPLLVLESDSRDAATGTILQSTRILYRSDAFQYEIE